MTQKYGKLYSIQFDLYTTHIVSTRFTPRDPEHEPQAKETMEKNNNKEINKKTSPMGEKLLSHTVARKNFSLYRAIVAQK